LKKSKIKGIAVDRWRIFLWRFRRWGTHLYIIKT